MSFTIERIERMPRVGELAASFAEQRMWFLSQLSHGYQVSAGWRLTGALDVAALTGALDRIVERHEVLRTTFVDLAGQLVRRIAPSARFVLRAADLRGAGDRALDTAKRAEVLAPFDLSAGPLVRGGLWRIAEDVHVLLVIAHHLICDGWSMGVLGDELRALYPAYRAGAADPLPTLAIQVADYAAYHQQLLASEALTAQRDYWRTTLAGAPVLSELPADRRRPAVQRYDGDLVEVELDEALTHKLKAVSQRHRMTPYMTLISAWATLMARMSGQPDIVIGSVVANRARPQVAPLIGLFINTLPLRFDLSARPTVAQMLRHGKERILRAQRNQDLPFEQIVEIARPARSAAHGPLFQTVFNWVGGDPGAAEVAGLAMTPEPRTYETAALFDVTLTLGEHGARIAGSLGFATALFDRATIERYWSYFRALLAAIVENDRTTIEAIPLLPAEERARVVEEWNATDGAYDRERCIHELFEERAAEAGEAVAIRFGETTMTYAALNARANRLARELRRLGVGVERRAAICVERSPEMIVGLLAILKAGGVYVPLDASYPEARLRAMVADSGPVVVLSHAATAVVAAAAAGRVPVIDVDVEVAQSSADLPVREVGLTSTDLAYVIYTSGSTGTPKGIEVAHAPAINLIQWVNETYEVGRGDCLLFVTSMSFDLSVYDMFGTLAAGGTIWLADEGMLRDPERLARVVEDERVTFWDSAPAALQLLLPFVRRANRSLRLVFNSGDWVPLGQPGAVAAVFPNARFIALGGATEATVWSNYFEVTAVDPAWRSIPYGRPIRNARYYVLDEQLEPVPIGVTGELYIGGGCLAAGYTSEGLTRERFLASPFVAGERIYRTGDQARFWPSGVIEFLGRNDTQVKIRGFRIELGEIEAQLRTEVRDAVVIVREDVAGDRRLVAYYVADGEVTAEGLASHVGKRLPEYMVPTAYVRMSALPVTANGKLDRKALPRPGGEAYASRSYEAPHGEVEVALARIWSEVLGVERISRHDDFFELGGHSLLAVRVLNRVKHELGISLPPSSVFEASTLAAFTQGALAELLVQLGGPAGLDAALAAGEDRP